MAGRYARRAGWFWGCELVEGLGVVYLLFALLDTSLVDVFLWFWEIWDFLIGFVPEEKPIITSKGYSAPSSSASLGKPHGKVAFS